MLVTPETQERRHYALAKLDVDSRRTHVGLGPYGDEPAGRLGAEGLQPAGASARLAPWRPDGDCWEVPLRSAHQGPQGRTGLPLRQHSETCGPADPRGDVVPASPRQQKPYADAQSRRE